MIYILSTIIFLIFFLVFSFIFVFRLRLKKNYRKTLSVQKKLLWKFPKIYSYMYALTPNLSISILDKVKNNLIEKELLIVLDHLSANLSAGISIQETLEKTLELIKAPLNNEIRFFLLLAKKHSSINALEHCVKKAKNIFLKIFWITLLSHYKNGSALSDNIKKLLKILSLRINIKERINAQLIGVKVQVIAGILLPYILFIVMNLLYPYLISPVLNSELGLGIIFFAFVLHSIGVWFFIKIIAFDTKKDLNSSMLFEYMSFSIRGGVAIKKSLDEIKESELLEKEVIKVIDKTEGTSELISALLSLDKKFQNIHDLARILKRAYQFGISIADDLSSRSSYIMENLEQRALRFQQIVPSKALIPLFLCIFPATYLLILAPIIVEVSFSIL
jgi:hypothetical protein